MSIGEAVLIAFSASIITLAALTIAVVKIPAIWGRISASIDTRMDAVHARHMRASLAESRETFADHLTRSRALDDEYRTLVLNAHNEDNL